MTQKTSKPRVKKDSIGAGGITMLFQLYERQDTDSFRASCAVCIEQSTGSRQTKDKFIRELNLTFSKDNMIRMVTNYLLAGQGLGV